VSEPKPFAISKWVVWEAYGRVKANQGAAGVEEGSMAEFEVDLKGNLDKLWNRLSSGSYLPPPVRAVEIPKNSGGVRVLGVPTVADRIAQTVVRLYLEPEVEPMFHPDSYGYRPGRSALDAVGVCRERCWKADWVIDLDIKAFFDSLDHQLVVRAVSKHIDTDRRWILLYVKGWLVAPLQRPDGTLVARDRGSPQGSAISPCSPTSSCPTRSMPGWPGPSRASGSNATATMSSCTAPVSSKPGRSGTPSRSGWRRAAWS
jgi:RNA-directed DNA polymerase